MWPSSRACRYHICGTLSGSRGKHLLRESCIYLFFDRSPWLTRPMRCPTVLRCAPLHAVLITACAVIRIACIFCLVSAIVSVWVSSLVFLHGSFLTVPLCFQKRLEQAHGTKYFTCARLFYFLRQIICPFVIHNLEIVS